MSEVQVYVNFMGEDFLAYVEYEVTYKGHPGTRPSMSDPGDPPEGPEWNVTNIILCRGDSGDEGPPYEVPAGAMFNVLANLTRVDDAIIEAIQESRYDRYRDDYD